jgi:type IV pilus assembly protein PilA
MDLWIGSDPVDRYAHDCQWDNFSYHLCSARLFALDLSLLVMGRGNANCIVIIGGSVNCDRVRGFTLIELMIVVAIIGILAAIAIPAYQNYVTRSQVSEGLILADGWKPAIAEYYANNGTMPSTTSALAGSAIAGGNAVASTGKYVSSVGVTAGALQIIYGNQANVAIKTLSVFITPYTNLNNDLIWVCGSALTPSGLTLATGASSGTTSVPPVYLPGACHA